VNTAVDTNVIVALWDPDAALSSAVQFALDTASEAGGIIVSAPVFAELLAARFRDEQFMNRFIADTGLILEWEMSEQVWRTAGRAYQLLAARRRRQRETEPRRILADFLIGAHAAENGYRLLTLDARFYRLAFPKLNIIAI
jgi:predicted nucleic acid-binding protein